MALTTLGDLIERLQRQPAAPAVIAHRAGGAETWTAGEIASRARALAAGLRQSGLAQDEIVGLLAPSQPEWVLALLAIVRAGAIALPLSEQITASELARILRHSGCRRICTTRPFVRVLECLGDDRPGDLSIVRLDREDEDARRPPRRDDEPAPGRGPGERATAGGLPAPGRPAPGAKSLARGEVSEPDGGGSHWRQLLRDDPAALPELHPDQHAVLVYTSGTTGTPKGVPLSHANLTANINALLKERLAGPDDRVLLPLPLHHAYPLTVGLLTGLAAGAAVVLPSGISGPEISHALADCRCTIMVGVPRLYEAMLNGIESRVNARAGIVRQGYQRLLALSIGLRRRFGWRAGRHLFWPLHRQLGPELRLLASGGARLEPEIAWKLEGLGWEVLTGYGLTETSPILTFNPPGRARLDSAGLPVEGVELRIAPEEDTTPAGAGGEGKTTEATPSEPTAESEVSAESQVSAGGEEDAGNQDPPSGSGRAGAPGSQPSGEIQAKGQNVFAGYWHNPEATREAFTGDGFFRTGDLGCLDAEGYLHIVGRSKELIVLAGGKNIFPEEVEAVYADSPLIHELAVIDQGGRLVGLIVPEIKALQAGDSDALRQRLRAELEERSRRLASYQRLSDFAITAEPLPRTQIGKLRRHELGPLFERAKAGADAPTTAKELSARDRALLDSAELGEIWHWLEERFAPKPLSLDSSPQLDLGLDSFDWMSLTMELGERFGAQLSEDAVARVTTLRDLLVEIERATESTGAALEIRELSPEQEHWLQPQSWPLRALAAVLFGLNRIIMRGLFRLRVEGQEDLPAEGPFLLAPNHASYLDPFAIAAALSWSQLRRLYWAGWTGLLFRGPITRLFSRATRVLPVDPERGLTSTLPLGLAALERGSALVWFPEGARSTDGEMHRFLPGAGLLIERAGVPAVPVWIGGTFDAWPPDRTLPRFRPVQVRFGRPLAFQPDPSAPNGERHRQIADRLHDAVAALAAGSDPAEALPAGRGFDGARPPPT